ncbi:MAG: dihydroorotase [Deltaproteobacteria bacterium RIFCSPHIGHO2_02_FULL_40_11]|nr:MAG: dihydroorotase [Deltaproteobacteria bacterium RIFCSPHIGHO2_02_FULL_40_11]
MKCVIKNGFVIDPAQNIKAKKDILIVDGKIQKMSSEKLSTKNCDQVIDAKDRIVCPGLIDMHTHLREPGFEHKETIATGSKAAAAGGFTSIACMANTDPVNDNAYITQFIKLKAEQEAVVNVYPIGALSKGLQGENLSEIGSLKEAGCIAISDDGNPVMNSYLMRKALDYCRHFNLPIISHCEDTHLVGRGVMNEGLHSTALGLRGNPTTSEEIMVARDIALSELTKSHVHFAHISTEAAVRLIRDAKKRKVRVSCEVTPHHLFLTDDQVSTYDTNFKMAPPLRGKEEQNALKKALKEGVIDTFATDHAPHSVLEKQIEFENAAYGVIGLETALPLTLKLVDEKVLSLEKLIEKWTVNPARILGLKKGTLKKGWDADITIFDPKKSIQIHRDKLFSKSKNTPFHGWKLKGQVIYTLVGGKIVFQQS